MSNTEYIARLVDLPPSVGGYICESPDGYVNIYINARHGYPMQRKSWRHELRHAKLDDLHSSEPVAVIEARADGIDPRLKAVPKLIKARDLLAPLDKPKPRGRKLSPRQLAAVLHCIAELDKVSFDNYDE